MKKIFSLLLLTGSILMLTACGGSKFSKMKLNDGVYTGEIAEGDPLSYTKVTLVIKDNKIVNAEAEYRDTKKEIKDENYGKGMSEKLYAVAQKAVAGMNKYPIMLLEVQDPDKVDTVSGATASYKTFKEATWKALEAAKK